MGIGIVLLLVVQALHHQPLLGLPWLCFRALSCISSVVPVVHLLQRKASRSSNGALFRLLGEIFKRSKLAMLQIL